MTPRNWPEIFAAHPTSTDVELAAIVGVARESVTLARHRLDLPRRPARRVTATKGRQLWTRCPESTHADVHALANAEGVTASMWVLRACERALEDSSVSKNSDRPGDNVGASPPTPQDRRR